MTKIQLTLTQPESNILQSKADMFGYDLARYIKFIISKVVEQSINVEVPTFKASQRLEKRVEEAVENYKKGNLYKLDNVEDLLHL